MNPEGNRPEEDVVVHPCGVVEEVAALVGVQVEEEVQVLDACLQLHLVEEDLASKETKMIGVEVGRIGKKINGLAENHHRPDLQ